MQHGEQTDATQVYYRKGFGGEAPVAGQFLCDFWEIFALLAPFELHFTRF